MISKRILLVSLMVFFTLSSFSQALDSLKERFKKEKNDSIKFDILLKLSKAAEFQDYALARRYAEEAMELAKKINTNWSKSTIYLRLAFLETMRGDYAEALRYDMECVKIHTVTKDSASLSLALSDVGADYRDLGEFEEGYFYLTQGYQMARTHQKVPSYDDSLVMSICLHNIGTIFTELRQFDIALSHLQASAKISEDINDPEGAPYSHDEIGDLYRLKGDYNQSEKNLLLALKEAHQLKIRFLIPRIHTHLAGLYLEKKDFKNSLVYYDSVNEHQKKINNRFGMAECDLGKGKVMARSGNFNEALDLYEKSLETAKELNARNLALACYKEMASLYEIRNDYANSLLYLKQHDALRDSIFSGAAMEKLFLNQKKFEVENKNTEIAALSKEKTEQSSEIKRQELVTNILVIAVALTGFLLLTVYRSGQRRKRINGLLLEHQEEIKKRSIELEQLNQVKDKFFSIISHDLRSPMNALSGTLDLLEQKNISQAEFSEVSKNLRTQFNHTRTLINNLLNWTLLQMDKLTIQPEKVVLHSKVEESFATLKMLYTKDIQMENKVNENVVAFADPNIVNLVLRNLILNAVKFTESGGHIWIDSKESDNEIIVSVSDNGIGIRPEVREVLFEKTSGYSTRGTANEKGTGLGLILCKEFVEKNGGRIWLESEIGKGTSFYFTLPKA
ncbi:MAG: tetratricopeptide repeat-containing sensor histidine kinase [Cyclobacteriaceae bacterium]|nr:tetratricopeptide repeat-containing sensor histidine kinase [Cyclobacteriaceae bacterium]